MNILKETAYTLEIYGLTYTQPTDLASEDIYYNFGARKKLV